VAALERTADDLAQALSPRGWHRAAHALVALARAEPERARATLPRFLGWGVWQLRMYAARAAAILRDRATLEKLAADEDDNVREAAIDGLVKTAGHAADPTYTAALARRGYQVVRAAAAALAGTPAPETAVPALRSALQRLVAEGHDNSHDARRAIADTLATLGAATLVWDVPREPHPSDLDVDDLRRLASPRARITIRDVGSFELALFTSEAPASVLHFAHLAETGYYNGLTFHRIVPNFVIQGGSPGANEYIGDAWFMRDELGLWPHVRGAVGISTRGHDTGDAQIFVDLVDNPRLDHDYTVFAQVLNGIEVVDQILEGDIIDRIEIVPGS
jgi:peptidyl-prolyl cis-trans isomerase B (cyclophilin B)